MALKWFSGIPYGTVNSFRDFAIRFEEQVAANKVKPPHMNDLFDIKQKEGESLKEYLNRFCEVSVCIQDLRDEMVVDAFVKGLQANPFSDSLLRNRVMSMTEVQDEF